MTKTDIDTIIKTICPNDEDFEKPIISPAYLKKELEALALEQEPCDTLKLDGMLEDAYEHGYQQARYDYEAESCGDCDKWENDKTACQKCGETCDDAVKREAVLNTLDTMDKALDENRTVEAYKELLKECYKELPPVTPASTEYEDAVSRQAMLDGLTSIAKAKARSDAQKALMGRVMFFTEQLPPVTPKPKTGKWIVAGMFDDFFKCIHCGYKYSIWNEKYNFCPHCGAKIERGE